MATVISEQDDDYKRRQDDRRRNVERLAEGLCMACLASPRNMTPAQVVSHAFSTAELFADKVAERRGRR